MNGKPQNGLPSAFLGHRGSGFGVLGGLLAALGLVVGAPAQTWQDYFTNRVTMTGAYGSLAGDNTGASIEPGEPLHAGKVGGHSLWIRWVAPTNGVVTFETSASRFDTLLAAYRFNSTNDTTLDKLLPVAWSDDAPGLDFESSISFGALAGQSYEIAVDGYYGATGEIELDWSFAATSAQPPTLLSVSTNRAANLGDTVTLAVGLTNTGAAQFQWVFNGRELRATATDLTIGSFQATNVGRYELRATVSGQEYAFPSIELQINTEGLSNVLAQPKLLDSPTSPLIGEDGSAPSGAGSIQPRLLSLTPLVGVVRGYNGTQIFNTTYSPADTNDPPHCGWIGGAPYWLMYQPAANGTLSLDTAGSTYDTVLEVYTFNGKLTGYQDLISLACNHGALASGVPSQVQTPVSTTRQYVVVVDGVNGARGMAWLNYSLNTNQPPQPPALLTPLGTHTVSLGSDVTLAPTVTGAAPMTFAWSKAGAQLPGATAAYLTLTNVTAAAAGTYSLAVTNDVGSLTASFPLRVLTPTRTGVALLPQGLQLTFPTLSGQTYIVLQAPAVTGEWSRVSGPISGTGLNFSTNLPAAGTGFFRVLIQ